MEKLYKKYKIYLLCIEIKQKQNIEKYVDSIVESENNINDKLNSIKNGSVSTIGDSGYISEQIKNISNNNVLLYNYQNDNIEYLDKYTKSQTDYDTYTQYYNYLNSKYNLNDYNNYNKTADKLINSVK